jgi:peptidylprolyl isomerase
MRSSSPHLFLRRKAGYDPGKKGDPVHLHNVGRPDDESVFDTSEGRDLLTFQRGKGRVVPGFYKAVSGMEVADKKTVTISAAEAHGSRIDQLTLTAPRENLPPGYDPQVGEMMGLETKDGRQMDVVNPHVDQESVKMDGNHPLAGPAFLGYAAVRFRANRLASRNRTSRSSSSSQRVKSTSSTVSPMVILVGFWSSGTASMASWSR